MSCIEDDHLSVSGSIACQKDISSGAGGGEICAADRESDSSADSCDPPEKLFSIHGITCFPKVL